MRPPPGTWPTTQACVLTGNGTSDLWVHRPALTPLSHTSQRGSSLLNIIKDHHAYEEDQQHAKKDQNKETNRKPDTEGNGVNSEYKESSLIYLEIQEDKTPIQQELHAI